MAELYVAGRTGFMHENQKQQHDLLSILYVVVRAS
jgi:hypothetical protein